ncbi:complex III assembly factor LYRM7-like [Haliotis rufescens]|uniref:complex III assembly factor LYRM7-like n=1 Tax=Haliotis rufescens TaxID=6454 RepID=UPI001EB0696C|nr:complex III assembly factor LYRM7-like [Haliotis rufescens]
MLSFLPSSEEECKHIHMSRAKVLSVFRSLHRARKKVFQGDGVALAVGRSKINDEFRKHTQETDANKIKELITVAEDSEKLLKKTVVQGKAREDGTYEIRITEDTVLEKNTLFDDHAKLPVKGRKKKCSDSPDT